MPRESLSAALDKLNEVRDTHTHTHTHTRARAHKPILHAANKQLAALPEPSANVCVCVCVSLQDARRSSQFMLYGLLAADEALRDAQWQPSTHEERVRTGVSVGSGMSSCGEIGDAWTELVSLL